MCGITGFCDFNKKSDYRTLQTMTDTLHHRGPNDSGYELIDTAHAQIGLGHRRLSILDLSPLGHQPMHFQHLTIIFNGEVYNFKEIRAELEEYGYTFKSDSDTEMILKAFDKWGTEAVHKFIGMFAFVILDNQKQQVYIYRDRAGVKPVYYYWKNNCLLFTSELKSFHKHYSFEKELDVDSLSLYLQYGYIPVPHCIFKNTYKLRPGHYLHLDLKSKTLEERKYWDVIDHYNKPKLDISEKEAEAEAERLMKSAFEYRMVADVPVGVFLSGGYDSSAVAGLLQTGRTEKIKTFTIGFNEQAFNEAPHAKKVAEHLGTDHTEYYCTTKEAADIIPTLPEIYDEPFGDNSVIPTILVSKLARQQVTVALSADGGDEIFAGYPKFKMAMKYTQLFPVWMQYMLSRSMNLINPTHIPYFNKQYNFSTRYEKVKNIWLSNSAVSAMKYITQFLPDKELKHLMAREYKMKDTCFEHEYQLNSNNDPINRMLAIDYKTFLVDNNLSKVDKATMSVSLEGREPLLDHRIIEFASRLPAEHKIRNGNGKAILKSVVHKYIPTELMDRPKQGFLVPIVDWFRKELKELFLYHLDREKLAKEGLFNVDEVIRLRDSYLAGNQENVQKLWHLLMFQMWRERWLDN